MITYDISGIPARITEIERNFLSALSAGSPSPAFTESVERLWRDARSACDQLDQSTIERLYRLAASVKVVASSLVSLEGACGRIGATLKERTKDYIAGTQTSEAPFLPVSSSSREEPDPFLPLRLWFLDNFSNPYPDAAQKDYFQTLYPTQTKTQIDTWFTNIRRRSGWQEVKRRYTTGSIAEFIRLVKDTEKDVRSPIVEEARKKIEKVKMYLREGVREKISDEIQQLVEKGAPSTTTKRTIAPRQRRKPKFPKYPLPPSNNSFDFAQLNSIIPNTPRLPPRDTSISSVLARPTPSSLGQMPAFEYNANHTSFVNSPSALTPLELSPQPRYPRTFSSPTTSLRSVSNSSSSSLDSVLSYDSNSSFSNSSFASLSPSSPPASSSLANYDAPTPSSQSVPATIPVSRPVQSRPRSAPAPVENPYFFTLNNTRLLPLPAVETDPVIATSSLAGFACNGDLIV
ncbi:uncharacterized protein JCM6883_007307 [Sporobolomyces salmoneus]|uniref:uncharacterized protein n=1 Tax=Sporobolomyces salmoneus TaxID=183962 RepID=UPI0031702450